MSRLARTWKATTMIVPVSMVAETIQCGAAVRSRTGNPTLRRIGRGRTALSGGPPHRSQRAELPHWAPGSGQTPGPGRNPDPDAHDQRTRRTTSGTVSGVRFAGHESPRPAPFPPPPPPPFARSCSAASQVLRGCPTSHHHSPGRTALAFPERPAPAQQEVGPMMGSPGSRAWRFRTCPGSPTARGPPATRDNAASSVAFHLEDSVGTPDLRFRGSIARPARAPVNASPRPHGTSTHDSGPPWVASPST
jgi:hypothetical protein